MTVLNEQLLNKAMDIASEYAEDYIKENGESPVNCGFAWVLAKNVRGNKAKLLKEYGFRKAYSEPGLILWNPSMSATQDMSAKFVGAQKYAEIVAEAGIDIEAHCRYD